MTHRAIRVLVVDDTADHAELVKQFVGVSPAWSSAAVETAGSCGAALAAFARAAYDVAFFDYWLGDGNGLTLLRDLRQRGIDTPVVLLTSHGAEQVAVEAMRSGAADYISKAQLSVDTIDTAIRHALALAGEERHRRQAEAALRASEERFRALVENSSDALILVDAQGQIRYVAPSSQRHLGWTAAEMIGRSVFEFLHPDEREAAGERMAENLAKPGVRRTWEVRFRHPDGLWHNMETTTVNRLDEPSVAAIVVNARDITDRRRLEDQLRQALKIEAVGRLAGGVAHDFNNLLTAILGYCNLILEDLPPEDRLRHDLEEIRTAGERAAALTRQLLAFSRRQLLQPQIVNVNELIANLGKMLRRVVREDIELVTAFAPELPPVRVDPASLEQVLLNLAVNARDVMPAGGRLTIQTACMELDAAYAESHASVVPGGYVMLAVGDNGPGMDADTCARIFDPFFTTKQQGSGSGLGLASVYGIVKQNGGYIWVYSEPGHGTVFKVYFPVAAKPGASAPAGVARPADAARASETVLLVEDEDAVRALAREVLRRQGYVVLEACHGVEALRVAERHGHTIHLLVTDVVMPHMSGRELADRLTVPRPEMKVLFMSGYTERALADDLAPGASFLQKPFTPDVFARKVRAVLDPQVS